MQDKDEEWRCRGRGQRHSVCGEVDPLHHPLRRVLLPQAGETGQAGKVDMVHEDITDAFPCVCMCAAEEECELDVKCDGLFPFVTNCRELTCGEILSKYKFQPMPEKRHELLNYIYDVTLVFLKSITRIGGVCFSSTSSPCPCNHSLRGRCGTA